MADQPENNIKPKQIDAKQGGCTQPTIPNDVVIPPDLPDNLQEYDKIPQSKRDEINDARDSALRAASQALESAQLDNADVKVDAKNKFDLAIQKADSKTKKQASQTANDIETLYATYKKSLKDAIPTLKNCSSTDDLPNYIKAIYVTQFKNELTNKKIEYQSAINVINNEKLAASAAWDQAKQDYDAAECNAQAVYEAASLAANLIWRNSLKTALEEACK